MARKIIQIATSAYSPGPIKLFALADDGTVWSKFEPGDNAENNPRLGWVRVPDLPEETPEERQAAIDRWKALGQ